MTLEYYLSPDDQRKAFKTLLDSVIIKLNKTKFLDSKYVEIINNYHDNVENLHSLKDIDQIALKTIDFARDSLLYLKFTDGLAFDLLKAWREYEDIIYLTRSTYRDHFMHQFYVFLLGVLLIPNIYEEILKSDLFKENGCKPITKDRFFRRWFLTSMFHDIGYTAETLRDISNTLNEQFFNKIPNYAIPKIEMITFQQDKTLERLIESISKIHLYSEFIPYGFITSTMDSNDDIRRAHEPAIEEINNLFMDEIKTTVDHGVNSAIFFLKTSLIDIREMVTQPDNKNTIFAEPLTDLLEDIYVSASAMAGHNLRSNTYPSFTVDFLSRPIAALLNFCDDLQEWDRMPNDHDWEKRSCMLLKIGSSFNNIKTKPEDLHKSSKDYKDINQVKKFKDRTFQSYLFIELKMKSLPHHDETIRVNQKKLMDNLSHLFKNNLSDKGSIFFDVIQVSGFSCRSDFIAVLEKDKKSYLHGRYSTSIIRKDKNLQSVILDICDEAYPDCFRCSYLNKHKKIQKE